jgi:hypothetical protein
MLIAKIDELVTMTSRDLDEIQAVTDQLEPDRAQSCRVVVGMCRVMLDEIRLRAHAAHSTATTPPESIRRCDSRCPSPRGVAGGVPAPAPPVTTARPGWPGSGASVVDRHLAVRNHPTAVRCLNAAGDWCVTKDT